jgi:diadenosine tetraphosphate (Ap4A) HIT family hydrolase
MSFALDERLKRDTFLVGDMPLSRILLMNDKRWPWLILVPRREGVVELTDLDAGDRTQLIEEAARVSRFLKAQATTRKVNLGALGNVVRQFHLHVIARSLGDPAWPGPVWGSGAARPYDDVDAQGRIAEARAALRLE